MAEERSGGGDQPATRLFTITPADNTELQAETRAIWVGGAGNINVWAIGDGFPTLISAVPAGTTLAIRARQVFSTSTTATLLVGMY
jgi:hypothetical protein